MNNCVNCAALGFFEINGLCGSCPTNNEWNGSECVCKVGFSNVNGFCVQACQPGQLVDALGQCFVCLVNEVIENNQCVCKSGFTRNPQNICMRMCDEGQVLINGICGTCVLGAVYNPLLEDCICPAGTVRNMFGFCVRNDLTPVTCVSGQFFDSDQGCLSCPTGCSLCLNANLCTECASVNFIPQGNQCVPLCGDGAIIRPSEQCDDGNIINGDGCSLTCQV